MKFFYINSDDFLKSYNFEFLQQFTDGKNFQTPKRFIQYSIGRYLIKSVGKNHFGISDTAIEIINNKPKFKHSNIKFSISHCQKYVAAAFDNIECGIDIEEIKPRNLNDLSELYNQSFNSLKDFYTFWTKGEAKIKLQQEVKWEYSAIFKNKYIFTVVSANPKCEKPSLINYLEFNHI